MSALTYKGYTARVEFDADDGLLTGTLAGIDDCIIFQAESVPELKKEFRDAVDDYLQTCAQLGRAPKKPASGHMMLRVPPELHAESIECAQLAGMSLNAWVRGLLERGVAERQAFAA